MQNFIHPFKLSKDLALIWVGFLAIPLFAQVQHNRGISLNDVPGIMASMDGKQYLDRTINGMIMPTNITSLTIPATQHVQGVGRLGNGNFVFSHDSKASVDQGIVAFSRPGSSAVFGTYDANGASWRHPSTMQACGNIVAVSGNKNTDAVLFFDGSDPNNPVQLNHLTVTPNGFRASSAGLVYHEKQDRYYMVIGSGVDDDAFKETRLFKSTKGLELTDPNCSFEHEASFNAWGSQGGQSLLYDVSGKLYMAVTYRNKYDSFRETIKLYEIELNSSGDYTSNQQIGSDIKLNIPPTGGIDPLPGFRWGGTVFPTSPYSVDVIATSRLLSGQIRTWSGMSDIEECLNYKIKVSNENLFLSHDTENAKALSIGKEWKFNKNQDGTYSIQLMGVSGTFYLKAPENPYAAGGNKISFDVTISDYTKWYIQPWENGAVRMYPKHKYVSGTVSRPMRTGAGNIMKLADNLDLAGLQSQLFYLVPVLENELICPNGPIVRFTDSNSCKFTIYGNALEPTYCASGFSLTNNINGADNLIGEEFAVGTTTVEWTLTANGGNSTTCSVNIQVNNSQAPTITCPANNQQHIADENNCTFQVPEMAFEATASGVCGDEGIISITNDFNNSATMVGAQLPLGPTTITYTATDENGKSASCSIDVQVNDNSPPTVSTCPSSITTTTFTPSSCSVPVYWGQTSFNDCQNLTVSSNFSSGDFFPVGTTNVIYTATDPAGNSKNCTFLVTISDLNDPTALCKPDFSVTLDEFGNAPSIYPADIDMGSSDPCTGISLSIEPSPTSNNGVDCSNIDNPKVFTLKVTDEGGRESTCTTTITAVDNSPPTVNCKDATVLLDFFGTGSIDFFEVYEAGSGDDNCGNALFESVSPNTFTCADIGVNEVTLTMVDEAGNPGTCTANVTVTEGIPPNANCKTHTVDLDGSGNATITAADIDDGSSDNCGSVSLSISQSQFTCADVGLNPVNLMVTDESGNTRDCEALVIVEDNTMAEAKCKDITIQLDNSGMAFILPTDIHDGSNGACGNASLYTNMSTFSCGNIGANTVTLTVSSMNGNSEDCTSIVTVEDNIPPGINCPQDIVVNNDPGECTAVVFYEGSASDNCSVTAAQLEGIANGGQFPLGTTLNTFQVTDPAGLQAACSFTVTVLDNENPTAICPAIADVVLDIDGTGSLPENIGTGLSTDNCSASEISPSMIFDCDDVGIQTVAMTVTDGFNTATVDCFFNVVDNTPPTATCQPVTRTLDANGTLVLTPTELDNNSSDACGIATLVLSQTEFDCTHLGVQSVTLTLVDSRGNSATCSADVTVIDNTLPTANCKNAALDLDLNGMAILSMADIDNGSVDNCGIVSRTLDASNFTCSDLGTNTVTMTVADLNGNSSSCMATVTVVDANAPDVFCQNISVDLNGNGEANIAPSDIYQSGNDNCGTVTLLSVFPNHFDCGEIGVNTVTLTATDGNGNEATCQATVTVEEFITNYEVSSTPEICDMGNGSITILASSPGGQLSYSIDSGASWQFSGEFSQLSSGSYEVMVQASGTSGCSTPSTIIEVGQSGSPSTWWKDIDGDGWSDGINLVQCQQPSGFYLASDLGSTNGDCNDYDANEHPGQIWYEDMDGDGYGSGFSMPSCIRPNGFYLAIELTVASGDCDDDDSAIHPTATEVCNGIDDNCDGQIDEGLSSLTYTGNVNLLNQAQVNAWSECYTIIDGNLTIKNSTIDSLPTLVNLQKVTGNVFIKSTKLDSLSWLLGLDTIGGYLKIQSNNQLETLHGLDSLKEVSGFLKVYFNNPLTNCCAIHELLDNNGIGGSITIRRNDTGCDNVSQVESACSSSNPLWVPNQVGENEMWQGDEYALMLDLYPNPASETINIRLIQNVEEGGKATLFNAMGQMIEQQEIFIGQESLSFDMTNRRAAEYVVRVTTERGTKMEKVMVVR